VPEIPDAADERFFRIEVNWHAHEVDERHVSGGFGDFAAALEFAQDVEHFQP
jgi:hypothetical protein